jgi:hypothetical protein
MINIQTDKGFCPHGACGRIKSKSVSEQQKIPLLTCSVSRPVLYIPGKNRLAKKSWEGKRG